ncbi:MAG: hypothetical protein OQK05_14620 [Pseudopelagicola sp.]|nr:hypothetical protein [Pseudopelagicola sp.]
MQNPKETVATECQPDSRMKRRAVLGALVSLPVAGAGTASPVDPHVTWYEQWRKAWDAITDAVDDTPQEAALFDELERLSILLCNTPARTPEGLLAQVSWMEADLGTYITEPVSEQHSDVFKVLKAGLAFLSA